MKRRMIAAAGTLLAGALFVLAGCGGGDGVGKLKGNFETEATAEEFKAALEAVDTSNAFGDRNAEDWSLGLQLLSDLSYSIKITATAAGERQTMSMSASLGLDYKLGISAAETLGAGTIKLKERMRDSSEPDSNYSTTLSAKMYHDSEYFYLENTNPAPNDPMSKFKYSAKDFMELLGEYLGSEEMPDFSDSDEGDVDIAEAFEELVAQGYKVYLDTSDGLKMKISATQELLVAALEDSASTGGLLSVMDLSYKATTLDIYFAISADGKFEQFSLDMDVNIGLSTEEDGVKMSGSLVIKGGFALKAYDGAIRLPDGIATDSSYQIAG